MLLTFENELGTLELSGNADADFRICKISGLDLQEKSRNVTALLNYDGQTELNSSYPARCVTVSGDIFGNPDEKARAAMKILAKKGNLTVLQNGRIRRLDVNNVKLAFSEKNSCFWQFTMQLTCDYPHFYDADDTEAAVCRRTGKITDSAVLPLVFTERVSETVILNDGDVLCEPVFVIRGGEPEGEDGSMEIEVNNRSITLDYSLAENETVTVDIPNRKIVSSINGDILSALAQNSYLGDIMLPPGENSIRVIAYDANSSAFAAVKFRKNYLTI